MSLLDKAKNAVKSTVYFFIPIAFLKTLAEKIKGKRTDEIWEYPAGFDFSDRQVLIGVLRNKAQLDIALRDNFYHIPAYLMENESFPINYIAIYQSKSLFGKKAGIRYYGVIDSVTPVKRKDIKQIPKDSEEYYYYVKVKEWKYLEKVIKPKESGFIKETTTYFQLMHSNDVAELLLSSKREADTYFKVKSAAKLRSKSEDLNIQGCTLKFTKSRIAVFKNNEVMFTETYEGFNNRPLSFIRKISDD